MPDEAVDDVIDPTGRRWLCAFVAEALSRLAAFPGPSSRVSVLSCSCPHASLIDEEDTPGGALCAPFLLVVSSTEMCQFWAAESVSIHTLSGGTWDWIFYCGEDGDDEFTPTGHITVNFDMGLRGVRQHRLIQPVS